MCLTGAERSAELANIYLKWKLRSLAHMAISSQDLALLKSSSRIVHTVASPLLAHPEWRRLVFATQRVTSSRTPLSPLVTALTSVAKQQQRSRHGSGSSVKSRSSLANTDSPDVRKKKLEQVAAAGASVETEAPWHVTLRRRFIEEYVEYLRNNSFHKVTLISKPPPHSRRSAQQQAFAPAPPATGSDGVEDGPVYLQRTLTGGVLLLELVFKRPFFTVSVYALDCTKNPQLADSKTKRVSCMAS